MFVTVFYWLLTLFLLIINLANGKIRHIPWTRVVGALLYTVIVDSSQICDYIKKDAMMVCENSSTF